MREWLYTLLSTTVFAENSVFEASALDTVPETPFAVYSFGNTLPEIEDGNRTVAASQYVNIWVHDTPGDYQVIDSLLTQIRTTLEDADTDEVICARFLSISDDLRDPEMGTITRYSRYQLIQGL